MSRAKSVAINEADVDRTVLLLIANQSEDAIEKFLMRGGQTAAMAKKVIEAAVAKLAASAKFSHQVERGKQIKLLEQVLQEAKKSKDIKALQLQLQVAKEIARFKKLSEPDELDAGGATAQRAEEMDRTLKLIGEYIKPLKLLDDTYPLEEHVRVASEICRRQKVSDARQSVVRDG